jgi:hypothetical protein
MQLALAVLAVMMDERSNQAGLSADVLCCLALCRLLAHLNVVTDRVSWVEADDAVELHTLVLDKVLQHLLRLRKQLLGL